MEIVALGSRLDIGYVAENNAREIGIDIAQLLSKWPTAVPHLMVVRPGEDLAYTAETRVDGTVLVWTIKNIDTALHGRGEAQVFMIEDDTELLGKSEVMSTLVRKCITCTEVGEAPEPVRPWMEQIKDDASAAEAARVAAGKSATAAANSAKSASDSLTNVQSAERTALQNIGAFSESVLNLAPMIKGSARGDDVVTVNDSASRPLVGLTLYGKTTQDGTPTPEAPVELVNVGAGGSISVQVRGKNLMPSLVGAPGGIVSGVTVTRNADGTVTLDGTATASGYIYLTTYSPSYNKGIKLPAGTYRVTNGHAGNFDGVSQNLWYRVGVYRDGKTINGTNAFPKNLTIADGDLFESYIQLKEGETYSNLTFKPMICAAGAFTDDYEPYKDGGSMTALAPNGLPGIPVTSGGNYIDSTGRQWVCDEIDYVRKVYVRRVGQIHLKGTETISSLLSRDNSVRVTLSGYANAANGQLQYSNRLAHKSVYSQDVVGFVVANNNSGSLHLGLPLTVGTTISAVSAWIAAHPIDIHYVLETPIETELSADELSAYATLIMQYPNSTIFCDDVCGVTVTYAADTKLYIDNKFAELAAASLNA